VGEAVVSPDFATLLAERRDALNTRFRAARAALPRLDIDGVLDFLAETLAPIVDTLSVSSAGAVLEQLFDVALPLLGKDLLGSGARLPYVRRGWEELLPRWPHLLAQQPLRLARALSNALHALANQAGARPADWIEAIGPIGERASSVDDLLEAGKVLAWRCGLAQYRAGALDAARRLPPELAAAALGARRLTDQVARDALIARLRADPWTDPSQSTAIPARLRLVATTGAFQGFGGPFAAPPAVSLVGEELVVEDGKAHYALRADRFGSVFLRIPPPPAGRSARPRRGSASRVSSPGQGTRLTMDADGNVRWGDHEARFPELADASSAAFDGRILAVTLPLAHAVFLLALTSGDAQ